MGEIKLSPGIQILCKYDWISGVCCDWMIEILLILIDKWPPCTFLAYL